MNTQLVEIVHGRSNPMIDPTLHVWGWEVPVYLFLGGMVAGIMILIPLLEFRTGRVSNSTRMRLMPAAAIGLISLGMGSLFLDLAYKLHVFRFYLTFEPTSPMSWGSWILMGVYPTLGLLALGGLAEQERERFRFGASATGLLSWVRKAADWSRENRKPILWASIGFGIALGTYTGLLLGTLSARLLWSSAILGPLFMTSGLSSGAAVLLFAKPDTDELHAITKWDAIAIAVELMLLGVLLVSLLSGGAPQRAAAEPLLGGSYTPVFWSLVVCTGLITPLILEMVEMKSKRAPTLLAPILVLIGGYALRAVLVAAGQATSFSMLS